MKYKITICTKGNKELLSVSEGINLHTVLSSHGYILTSPCGGHGICGKCRILAEGHFLPPIGNLTSPTEISACKAYPLGDCTVYMQEKSAVLPEVIAFPSDDEKLGIAFDVGTTSISAVLCSLERKCELSSITCRNAQISFGADIISRMAHPAEKLSEILISQINSIIRILCPDTSRISKLVFSANTVMSHYIAGLSPDGLSSFPLSPADTFGKIYSAKELGLGVNAEVYIFPSLAPFVGGDISSGLFSLELPDSETTLLLDLGTNGEMALCKDGRLFVASAAAGPAFEGGELSCGICAIPGAVISFDGETFKTVGDLPPCGIAGSGAIDLLARLLELGTVDRSGRLLPPDEAPTLCERITYRDNEVTFEISDDVYLSATDIRSIQLAKAAIRACLSLLLKESKTEMHEIKKLYIAGELGANINAESASGIGLIPSKLLPVCSSVGNTSLKGAIKLLFDGDPKSFLPSVSRITTHVDLSGNRSFEEEFIENINM